VTDSIFPRLGTQIEGVASALDQISSICDRYEHKLLEAEEALLSVRREYATWVISTSAGNAEVADPEALVLVRRYSNHPVGICQGCRRKAPLIAADTALCAWGCSLRPSPSIAP
jgi:hypothetical protein